MRIAGPKEAPSERRVALTPKIARRFIDSGHSVVVESGLGEAIGFPDGDYVDEGAEVCADPLEGADLTLVVGPPSPDLATAIPEGSTLVGFLDPFTVGPAIRTLAERRITAFAVEAIPRTTLAQSMDALSSQASAAGYHAVLLAATATPRFFPMLITAAVRIPANMLGADSGR